jgi:shikimate dehydrogenase
VRKFVDVFTPVADAVGAVNTIYRRQDGKLVGDNTDVPGFMRGIQYLAPDPSGVAVVFGAGGSARAVVYGLCSAGWVVHVLSRRPEQASQLVDEIVTGRGLSGEALAGRFELEDLRTMISGPCGLLVNTTPVGMYPKMQETPWPPGVEFPQHTAVYDLIYNPLETLFLHQARAAGLRGLNGAGMLVNQAALAFQHWTGCQPPFEVMQQAFPRQLPLNQ